MATKACSVNFINSHSGIIICIVDIFFKNHELFETFKKIFLLEESLKEYLQLRTYHSKTSACKQLAITSLYRYFYQHTHHMLPRYILKYISNMMHLIFDEEAVADLGIWEGVSTGTRSKMQGSGCTALSRCQGFSLRNLTTFTVLLIGIYILVVTVLLEYIN